MRHWKPRWPFTPTCTLAPTHAQAWLGLGRAQHALGRDAAALGTAAPGGRSAARTRGRTDEFVTLTLARGERSAAFPVLRRVLQTQPRHLAANLTLGTLHDQDYDFAAAAPCFERVVAAEPGHARARFGLGRALFEAGRRGRARWCTWPRSAGAMRHSTICWPARTARPAHWSRPTPRSRRRIEAGDDRRSRTTDRRACGCGASGGRMRSPRSGGCWTGAGRFAVGRRGVVVPGHRLSGRGRPGRGAGRRGGRGGRRAGDARATTRAVSWPFRRTNGTLAQRAFETAARVDPGYAPARFGLGLVREHAGEHTRAAEAYESGLAALPGWTPGVVRLGAALIAAVGSRTGSRCGPVRSEPTARHASTWPGLCPVGRVSGRTSCGRRRAGSTTRSRAQCGHRARNAGPRRAHRRRPRTRRASTGRRVGGVSRSRGIPGRAGRDAVS